MTITATGFGGPCNGLPEPKPYRWHGNPMPAPKPVRRRKTIPVPRQERLETLARVRVSAAPTGLHHLPDGVLTHAQAADMLGVSRRTILRDLQALREMAGAS